MKRILFSLLLAGCCLLAGCFDLSPNGSQIVVSGALTSSGPKDEALTSILDGQSGQLQPLPGPKMGVFPKWSPDGRSIVFDSLRETPGKPGPANQLWIYDVATKTSSLLSAGFPVATVWRDDSKVLIGCQTVDKNRRRLQQQRLLWLDVHSRKVVRYLTLPSGLYLHEPQFLPLSNEVVFRADGQGLSVNLYRTRGTGIEQLTTTGDVRAFRVLPSSELMWARTPHFKESNEMSLFRAFVGAKALAQVRRMPFSNRPVNPDPLRDWQTSYRIALSPDGRQLALCDTFASSLRNGKNQPQQFGMCVLMNIDGTKSRELHRTALFPTPLGRGDQEWGGGPTQLELQWSRDGQRLVVFDEHQNPRRFFLFNSEGDLQDSPPLPLVNVKAHLTL